MTIIILLGRRSCVGESLARMKQFLIFSTLMQRFKVKLSECSGKVTDEPKRSLGMRLPDHLPVIVFIVRQQQIM